MGRKVSPSEQSVACPKVLLRNRESRQTSFIRHFLVEVKEVVDIESATTVTLWAKKKSETRLPGRSYSELGENRDRNVRPWEKLSNFLKTSGFIRTGLHFIKWEQPDSLQSMGIPWA